MANDQPAVEMGMGATQGSGELSDALSDPYSQYVLRYLHEHRTAKLEELVDVVFGAEVAGSDRIATPATREPVRSSICNTVLPKLDELGYVDFDPNKQTITRTDIPREVFLAVRVDES